MITRSEVTAAVEGSGTGDGVLDSPRRRKRRRAISSEGEELWVRLRIFRERKDFDLSLRQAKRIRAL